MRSRLGLFILAIGTFAQRATRLASVLQLAASFAIGRLFCAAAVAVAGAGLPVDLLRIPLFALSIATSILSFVSQMLAYVSLPFHIQGTLGRTVVETGILMTPWPVCTAAMAPIAGRLADRYPAGILGGVGLAIMAAACCCWLRCRTNRATLDIAWRMAALRHRFRIFQTPNNRAILMTAPLDRSGSAGGMLSTARLVGQTTGAALVASDLWMAGTVRHGVAAGARGRLRACSAP